MLRTSTTRVLDGRDLEEARALLRRDPVCDVFVASRLEAGGLDPWRLGAELPDELRDLLPGPTVTVH